MKIRVRGTGINIAPSTFLSSAPLSTSDQTCRLPFTLIEELSVNHAITIRVVMNLSIMTGTHTQLEIAASIFFPPESSRRGKWCLDPPYSVRRKKTMRPMSVSFLLRAVKERPMRSRWCTPGKNKAWSGCVRFIKRYSVILLSPLNDASRMCA